MGGPKGDFTRKIKIKIKEKKNECMGYGYTLDRV